MTTYTVQLRRRLDGNVFTRTVDALSATSAGLLFNSAAFEIKVIQAVPTKPPTPNLGDAYAKQILRDSIDAEIKRKGRESYEYPPLREDGL